MIHSFAPQQRKIRGWAVAALTGAAMAVAAEARGQAPLMQDFIGLDVHSIGFQPGSNPISYSPVTSLVRDYHPMNWDLNSPDGTTQFPNTVNGVNWQSVYGSWAASGFRTDVDLQFELFDPSQWTNMATDAYTYGQEVAHYFGSTAIGGTGLANSVEIGNEPGNYSDAQFTTIFQNMAEGIRSVDPTLPIVTCNVNVGPSGSYSKSVSLLQNMTNLFDVLAIHTYPYLNGYPTWQQSYPEDPRLTYLSDVQALINWRNQYAPGKQVWVTEFGYDATTAPNESSGTFANEVFVNDTQQAQYLVRSYLAFSRMGVDRAYMYYYNDNNVPELHASSGLTRNYVAKPAYYAVANLQQELGDYRFTQAVEETAGSLYIYAYTKDQDPSSVIWVMWSPTGSGREAQVTLSNLPGTPLFADQMPLAAGAAPSVPYTVPGSGEIQLTISESPIYLHLQVVPEPAGATLLAGGVVAWLGRRRRRNAKPPEAGLPH